MKLEERLHQWYLEAISKISPTNFNAKAAVPYEALNEDQKFIDKHIAAAIKKLIEEVIGEDETVGVLDRMKNPELYIKDKLRAEQRDRLKQL